ncbi:MAG TPA: potassium channel family protein [Gemmatimonadales bacterium]|nr:potassium channel family protein [Gemmatimonadales bacterium]
MSDPGRGCARGQPRDTSEQVERVTALAQLEAWLETPMQVLGFVWLGLLVLELTRGLSPTLGALSTAIWIVFIVDFVVRFTLAPAKRIFLTHNWLALLSLAVPALRFLRVFRVAPLLRAARAARGARLVRVVGSLNRGMNALARGMGRRGLGYVVLLTLLVTLVGAAGMYAFERGAAGPGAGLADYPTALWWTAMVMTTMGSEYWPRTAEGRVLCIILALYAFTVFGYVTAALATFFIGRDAQAKDGELAGATDLAALRDDLAALRAEVRALGTSREESQ